MQEMINDPDDSDRPNCATPTPATPPTLRPVGRPMMPRGFYTTENDPVLVRQQQIDKFKQSMLPKNLQKQKTPPVSATSSIMKNPLSIKLPNILSFSNKAGKEKEKIVKKTIPIEIAPKNLDLETSFQEVQDSNLPMDWGNVIGLIFGDLVNLVVVSLVEASNTCNIEKREPSLPITSNTQNKEPNEKSLENTTPTDLTDVTPSSANQIRPFFKRIRSALNWG